MRRKDWRTGFLRRYHADVLRNGPGDLKIVAEEGPVPCYCWDNDFNEAVRAWVHYYEPFLGCVATREMMNGDLMAAQWKFYLPAEEEEEAVVIGI